MWMDGRVGCSHAHLGSNPGLCGHPVMVFQHLTPLFTCSFLQKPHTVTTLNGGNSEINDDRPDDQPYKHPGWCSQPGLWGQPGPSLSPGKQAPGTA